MLPREGVSVKAKWRLFRYLNCNQATLGTIMDYLGEGDGRLLKVNCQLEGGGFSAGSTCGVVSGGCLAIGLKYLEDIKMGNLRKLACLHALLKDYTSWFEREFGSTLCRERSGVRVNELGGFVRYLFLGNVFTRCMSHIGRAANHLAEILSAPLEEMDQGGLEEAEHCAIGVMRKIREKTGIGDETVESLYVTMDGGVGLSGGLCGAVAGAFMPLGWKFGIDPKSSGMLGTLRAFVRGHVNLYRGRKAAELWAVGKEFLRDYFREFASLECRDLTGKSFQGFAAFALYTREAEICQRLKDWSSERVLQILAEYG
jgi:hypothetical protein